MTRRASSRNQIHHYILLLAFGLVLAIGIFYVFGKAADPYRKLSALEISTYYANANSLRGNTYKIRAIVKNSLAWDPGRGRIISIIALNADNKETDPVAILVPKNFDAMNLQRGQQFYIQVEVGERGLLIARDFQKI
jgi:uncharacterized protein (UPF0333 family)